MSDENTRKFTKEVLLHMRERLSDYQEKYEGELFNLEATPANLLHIVWQNTTESAGLTSRLPERREILLTIQTVLIFRLSIRQISLMHWIFRMNCRHCIHQELYSMHLSVRNFLTGRQQPHWCVRLQRIINCRINTISPTYSVCKEHGYISGEHFTCPKCGKKAEVYSRITGYYRPVQNWNDGKVRNIRTVHSMM